MPLIDLVGPALDSVTDGAFSGALAMIQPQGRSIGQIFPDVVIEEGHRDESIITQEPVEGGAVVSDHVIDRPPTVEIRGGFSNSTAGYVGYVQEQYQALLALKASKKPFKLSTGKRLYKSMLINRIAVITDPHSEYTLMFVASCQFVNIVQTQSSGAGTDTTAAATSQSDQANPASTAGVSNAGNVEAQGVGSQAFAGSFSPGGTGSPSFDLSGGPGFSADQQVTPIDPVVGGGIVQPAPVISAGNLDIPVLPTAPLAGIALPPTLSFPDQSLPMIGGLQGAGPDQYNIFGGGP